MKDKTPAYYIEFNPASGVTDVAWDFKNMGRPSGATLAKAIEVLSNAWGVEFSYARVMKSNTCGEVVATWNA